MLKPSATPIVSPRDFEILAALDRFPLTSRQLLKYSKTFVQPFTQERRVRERLQLLAGAGRVRSWRYAIAGPGAPNYFTLSPQGFALLHGVKADPPSKRAFSELGVVRQFHAFALTEFLVHFFVAAHHAGHQLVSFERENSCRLLVGSESLFPDAAFHFSLKSGALFRYYVEVDNSTERIRSTSVPDTWQRKLTLYEKLASESEDRFRLLIVTTQSQSRLEHLLSFAQELATKKRILACGTFLPTFLGSNDPLSAACFFDQRLQPTPLLSSLKFRDQVKEQGPEQVISQTDQACYHRSPAAALTAAV